MRNLLALFVMSGVVLGSGCAAGPGDPPAQDYGFTKDSAGQALRADVSALRDFEPERGFDRTTEEAAAAEEVANASCSGVCNANVCVCSGDFECCVIGCVICWEVLQT